MDDWKNTLKRTWQALRYRQEKPSASSEVSLQQHSEKPTPAERVDATSALSPAATPAKDAGLASGSSQDRSESRAQGAPDSASEQSAPVEPAGKGILGGELPFYPRRGDTGVPGVNIGLDFGTSATKVCARLVLGGDEYPIYVVRLGGGAEALCPSLVLVDRIGSLYFGSEAEKRVFDDGTRVFPHLKTCLACEARDADKRLSDCLSSQKEGRCQGLFPGNVRPSDLVTCFLAWAMREARASLPADLSAPDAIRFTYNLGVPVEQLDRDSSLRDTYRMIAFRAWRLSEGMKQGIRLETAMEWIRGTSSLQAPPDEESPIQLCTEAGGALVLWLTSPDVSPGMYAVLDIGAWTTEIGVFMRVLTSRDNAGAFFLAAKVLRHAGNEVDERTHTGLFDLWDVNSEDGSKINPQLTLTLIRSNREAGGLKGRRFYVSEFPRFVGSTVTDFALECVAERILNGLRRALGQARDDKRLTESDRGNVQVLVSGGGAAEKTLWKDIPREMDGIVGSIDEPPSLPLRDLKPQDLRGRFAVAAGLALPLGMWPSILTPSQVDPNPPRMRIRRELRDPGYDDVN